MGWRNRGDFGSGARQEAIQKSPPPGSVETRRLYYRDNINPEVKYESIGECTKSYYTLESTRMYALSVRYFGDSNITPYGDPKNVNTFNSCENTCAFWEESILPFLITSVTIYYYDI